MATMRSKFKLDKVEKTEYSEIMTFSVVCPPKFDENGLSEDCTFSKFSPQGTIQITVTNPNLRGALEPGEKYYVDFTKTE